MTSTKLTKEAVLGALPTPGPPEGPPALYKLSLGLVALSMIVLPIVYIGVIIAVGFGTYYWFEHGLHYVGWHASHLETTGKAGMLAYSTILIAGPTLIVLMLKPLFARYPKGGDPLFLDRDKEPVLFALIERICELQGAPTPSRVEVDLHVDAATSYRPGLLSFLSNDRVLTLGLPLAACMDVRQLTCTLSHEIGHFSQAFGTRAYHLIATINNWFYRAVHQRDSWDAIIIESSNEGTFPFSLVMSVVGGSVAASRWGLKGFLLLSQTLTDRLSHQMIFDADAYAVRMVGSDGFEATMRSMVLATHAVEGARHNIQLSMQGGHYPDNYPLVVSHNMRALSEEASDRVWTKSLEETADKDTCNLSLSIRLEKTHGAQGASEYKLDTPASAIFAHWDDYCTRLTRDWYAGWDDPEFDLDRLVPAKDAFETGNRRATQVQDHSQFFGTGLSTPLALAGAPLAPLPQAPNHAEYEQARQCFRDALAIGQEIHTSYWKQLEDHAHLEFALRLSEAGVEGIIGAMKLESDDPGVIREMAEQTQREQQGLLQAGRELGPQFTGRILGALALAEAKQADDPALAEFAGNLRQALIEQEQVGQLADAIEACRVPIQVAIRLITVVNSIDAEVQAEYQVGYETEASTMHARFARVEEIARALPVLSHDTVGFLLPNGVPDPTQPIEFLNAGDQLLSHYSEWNHQCLGAIAGAVDGIEHALGWEAIIAPEFE